MSKASEKRWRPTAPLYDGPGIERSAEVKVIEVGRKEIEAALARVEAASTEDANLLRAITSGFFGMAAALGEEWTIVRMGDGRFRMARLFSEET